MAEILDNPLTVNRATGAEMRFLNSTAYEYGYTRVGETGTKTGPWRTSTVVAQSVQLPVRLLGQRVML